MNNQQIYDLINAAQGGDKDAKNLVFEENVGLIHMTLKRFYGKGYDMDDLFQIGAVGLMKSIKNFKTSFNYSFSTYAVPVILGEMKRYIRDNNCVHMSRKIIEDSRKISIVRQQFEKTGNREVTIEMLEQKTGLSHEDVIVAITASEPLVSLSKENIVIASREEEKLIDSITIRELLEKLEQKEREIIIMRYFKNMTQAEIAKKIGSNQVAVSRLEKSIMKKLRQYL